VNLDTIKEKVGPLPIWAWGVIVGVILLGVYYLFQRNKTLKSNSGVVTPDVYTGADSSLGYTVPAGNQSSVITETVETNQSWITKAVRYLSEQGYNSADAQVWLQQYVSGIPIVGDKAKAAIQEALDRFGTAPDTSAGVPTFVTAPPPEEPYATTVRQAYNTFLKRDPTDNEIKMWSDKLESGGMTVAEFDTYVRNSQEAQRVRTNAN